MDMRADNTPNTPYYTQLVSLVYMPPKVPPQSEALYLLAVATMGESMVQMLSSSATTAIIRRYLTILYDSIWSGNITISALEAMLAAPEYTAAASVLRTGVVRPLDGVRRSAQEVRPGLYISGKGPPMQPTLCRHLGITHILRCFAKQEKTEPPSTAIQSNPTCLWASMGGAWSSTRGERILPTPILGSSDEGAAPVFNTEDELVYCAPGDTVEKYSCRRLTLPSVDDDGYDITAHFQPEVFAFVENARKEGGAVLVHCSAGMHRSAVVICAILAQEELLSFLRGGLGNKGGGMVVATLQRIQEEVESKRPMAVPTPAQSRTLEAWGRSLQL